MAEDPAKLQERTADISSRWMKALRENAKTTLSYTCHYCKDQPVSLNAETFWQHFQDVHPAAIPSDPEKAEMFRRNRIKEASSSRYSLQSLNRKAT